jgi:Ca-activated chloride channel family protein
VIEWLRPQWLLLFPAGLLAAWLWWRARTGLGPWQRAVDPELLAALAPAAPAPGNRHALALGVVALALACAALAGPSWRTQPVALQRDAGARIVVLDLSPSMDAVDVAPSRLARARDAAAALLADAPGARLGLVVFGADAFSAAPLTSDPALLVNLLAGAATRVVPRAGSRPDLGLELARAMLADSGASGGEVILVGDSAGDARTLAAARALARAGFPLSVLAVGTAHGGPVRLGEGAFARSEAGDVLVLRSDIGGLERVAAAGGGRFQLLGASGPVPRIARAPEAHGESQMLAASTAAARQDDGALLALLALPFAALLFRRGWLACLAALACALPAQESLAFEWADLWRRADQQAAQAFAQGRTGEEALLAERLDRESPWRALLLHRAGRYAEAEALFAMHDTADAHYNRGNALALSGLLEAALAAYGAALERSPGMRDAIHNRALVRQALAQQRAQAASGEGTPQPEGSGEQPRARPGGARTRDAQREPAWDEPDLPKDERTRDAPPAAREDPAELRQRAERERLERLLANVPDDPASLLANRFAQQMRQRGTPQLDTGTRW